MKKGSTKAVPGIKGIRCPCCRTGQKREAKKADRRFRRRKNKETVRLMSKEDQASLYNRIMQA
jgi:hypothetical protein